MWATAAQLICNLLCIKLTFYHSPSFNNVKRDAGWDASRAVWGYPPSMLELLCKAINLLKISPSDSASKSSEDGGKVFHAENSETKNELQTLKRSNAESVADKNFPRKALSRRRGCCNGKHKQQKTYPVEIYYLQFHKHDNEAPGKASKRGREELRRKSLSSRYLRCGARKTNKQKYDAISSSFAVCLPPTSSF